MVGVGTTGLPFGFQMTLSSETTTPDRPFVKGVRPDTTLLLAGSPDLLQIGSTRRSFAAAKPTRSRRCGGAARGDRERVDGARAVRRTDSIADRAAHREHKVDENVTVVGRAKDTDADSLMSRWGNLVYLPFAQRYRANLALVARTSRDPADAVRVLRNAVRQADPDLAIGAPGPASWRRQASPSLHGSPA